MKNISRYLLFSFVILCTFLCANGGRDYIAKRGRNDYRLYEYAIFRSQSSSTTWAIPRSFRRPLPYSRDRLTIDLPPLKNKIRPGVSVLVQMGRDKYAADRYAPAQIVKEKDGDYIVKPVCDKMAPPVGIYDSYVHTRIPDSAFKASSTYPIPRIAERFGRLFNSNAFRLTWCPNRKDLKHPWLQVDLQKLFYICSVKTTASAKFKGYTITYTIHVSTDGSTWEYVKVNGKKKVFTRHSSPDVHHQYVGLIHKPYRYIRFYPTSYKVLPCLGVEVYGYGGVTNGALVYSLRDLRMEGSVCNLQTRCENTPHATCGSEGSIPGTYTCKCKRGFTGPKTFKPGDDATCLDINECSKNSCGKNAASCTNSPGSYRCNCKTGFVHDNGDLTKCKDNDECLAIKSPCSTFARCTNTRGSYDCKCDIGYYGDGHTCTDIDECNPPDGSTGCGSYYADCTNSPGSYSCTCWKGYTGNGDMCTDVNECLADVDPCASMNGKCVNNVGSYFCKCALGHQLIEGKCQDVDECKSPSLNDCNKNAVCTNKPGSYSCHCKNGFTGSGFDAFGCTDIDECVTKGICGNNSQCTNTGGSYNCRCNHGYTTTNGTDCQDIDECRNITTCHRLATCQNVQGSYTCTCPQGFTGSGQPVAGCTALAWCEWIGKSKCDQEFKDCNNVLRKCAGCKSGFEEIDGQCKDINECNSQPCGDGGICTNTPGSFTCKCKKGYHFDKKYQLCKDIDECHLAKRHCHDDAICKNTAGSFDCNCKPGFDGDGFFCADINECYIGDYKCPAHSVCSNLLGSYKCVCKKGYHRKGNACKKDATGKAQNNQNGMSSLYNKVAFWNTGSSHSLTTSFILAVSLAVTLVILRDLW